MRDYLLAFAAAMVMAYFITPLVELFALKVGVVDVPSERKVHPEPTPMLGGIAIYLAFLLTLIWFVVIGRELAGILLGGTLMLILGIIDDIWDLSPKVKFLGQLLAASILLFYGIQIEFVGNPLGGLIYLGGWSIPLTLFWVVGLTNTVNFIDGLDGLAAGVCGIALLTLSFSAHQTGHIDIAFICLILAGSALGFLKHNFNPARIFMGDSGSMFLGFMLGAITVQGVMKSIVAIALLVPLVVMGVPIFDAAFAIFRRYKNKQPVTRADDGHIHHRLLRRGFSHRQTVVILYLWCFMLSAAALALRFASSQVKIVVFVCLAILSFFFERYIGIFDEFRGKIGRK